MRCHAGVPRNPEAFIRPDGTCYIAEGADVLPLPEDPGDVEADPAVCARLQVSKGSLGMQPTMHLKFTMPCHAMPCHDSYKVCLARGV